MRFFSGSSGPRSTPLVQPGLAAGAVIGAIALVLTAPRRAGLERWWSGETQKLDILVPACFWWGGLAVVVLLTLLAFTAKAWARSFPAAFPAPALRPHRWWFGGVLLLMLAGAAVRAPRLGLSLYNDEAHVFRAHIAGRMANADLGKPEKYRPATWLTTAFENRSGNNAMPFSLAARASYDAWRSLTGTASGVVNETALRLPVLLCGVLSIGAMAMLGLRLGGPWMGLAAGLLTACHPWHLRYSVEARGYGMLFLVLPLLFLALHAALRTGRWRWWLAFGFMEYLAVATWFGSAHLLVGLNLTLAAMAGLPVIRERRAAALLTGLLVPTVVAGGLALGLYLQFNLPLYVQLAKSLADPLFFKTPHPFPIEWLQDTAGFLGFGTPGLALNPANPAQPTVAGWLGDPFWRIPAALGIAVWIAGASPGLVRLFRQNSTSRALAGAFTGGALLTFLYCSFKGIVFLKWYSLFLLPGLLLFLAAGLTATLKNRPPLWRTALLLPLLVCWIPALRPYLTESRENLRDPVRLARGTGYPASLTNPNRTLYAVLWSESPIYDPSAPPLKTAADLETLITRARTENRPLFISHGHTHQALTYNPDIIALLQDSTRFLPLPPLPGLDDASTTHYVYRLRP